MEFPKPTPISRWMVEEPPVITPYRVYKHMKNRSLPDLQHSPSPPKVNPHLRYNKWYIKPTQRLKDALVPKQQNDCDPFSTIKTIQKRNSSTIISTNRKLTQPPRG